MKVPKTISSCNYVVSIAGVKICGKPTIGTIHKAGYCKDHIEKAEKMFGKATMIVKEEMFTPEQMRCS